MLRSALLILVIFMQTLHKNVCAQTPEAYYRAVVGAVSGDSINKNLLDFENLGIKEENTNAIENTRLWLAAKYSSYSYQPYYDTFVYLGDTLYNVIADRKGSVDSNTWVIVCGHYDTEGGPGANDNGSGVAATLEIARILKDIPTWYSIRFINFAGEEDGFKGSIHYVTKQIVPANVQLRVVFNIDEIGSIAGITNTMITCERDEGGQSANNGASWHYTNVLDTMMRRYGELDTKISAAFLSDYIPFELNGFVITGLYESNVTPFRHTINDSIKNLDTQFVRKAVKGALAATMNFAGVQDLGKGISNPAVNTFLAYPNPADNIISFRPLTAGLHSVEIFDNCGRSILYSHLAAEHNISVHGFSPGVFFYRVIDADGRSIHSGSFIKR